MSALHHVSILTKDLERSSSFFQKALGLEKIARPPFKNQGVWLALGDRQLHLTLHKEGTFRSKPIVDNDDGHFAIRVADFEAWISNLTHYGFRENAADGDPMRLLVKREGPAGFPQAYFLDPDWNVVEINAER